jgi:hypothetical protein
MRLVRDSGEAFLGVEWGLWRGAFVEEHDGSGLVEMGGVRIDELARATGVGFGPPPDDERRRVGELIFHG